MDEKKYDRQIELVDMDEAQELAVKMIMQEGALRFQEQVLARLKSRKLRKAAKIVRGTYLEL
jgi:hypothetical protein